MTETGTLPIEDTTNEFVISRVFDAPRERVFKAWTHLESLKQWWGPKGFSMNACRLDLRPEGIFHYCMRSPEGFEMWGKFVYGDITAPERLIFVNSFSDKTANTVRAPFSSEWPLEIRNSLTFQENQGKTTLTLRGIPVNATAAELQAFRAGHESMQKGFAGTLLQLDEFLAKNPEPASL